MLRTKLLAASGLLLSLSSLLLGTRYWGYQRAVILLQAGGLSLVLGMFFRLRGNGEHTQEALLSFVASLYDMESGPN
jgi:hypothetical protein